MSACALHALFRPAEHAPHATCTWRGDHIISETRAPNMAQNLPASLDSIVATDAYDDVCGGPPSPFSAFLAPVLTSQPQPARQREIKIPIIVPVTNPLAKKNPFAHRT